MMYEDVDVDKKVKYLCEIDHNIISGEGIVDYIFDNMELFKENTGIIEELKVYGKEMSYFKIDLDGYPSNLSEDDIDTLFEEEIEKIIKDTSFLEDNPQYNENTNVKIR